MGAKIKQKVETPAKRLGFYNNLQFLTGTKTESITFFSFNINQKLKKVKPERTLDFLSAQIALI